ncbi:MAG: ABC transporter substrate-binding protein [Chloroflexi bacterium]|nr:ABC transporter substrate-binding protein [Chloroflexota bacterium]
MATIPEQAAQPRSGPHTRWLRRGCWLACLLALLSAGTACTDPQPVAKIGLLAPFEGLYRRTGYTALSAVRQAIAETGGRFIPLALDDSADPARARRSAQKLLVDPQLQAVIGPLTPALAEASAAVLQDPRILWVTPYAVDPDLGFVDPLDSEQWAGALAEALGTAVRRQGVQTLYLAGDRRGWPDWGEAEWRAATGLPTLFWESQTVSPTAWTRREAIFWLGAAAEAATFVNRLPSDRTGPRFWLGPAGGDPVLAERLAGSQPLYWLTWVDRHSPDVAALSGAPLVYQATQSALARLGGTELPTRWRAAYFEIRGGVSHSYTP